MKLSLRSIPGVPRLLEALGYGKVITKTSSAVKDVLEQRVIVSPSSKDYPELEPGDILTSSREGTMRLVLANDTVQETLLISITRDTSLSLAPLPVLYKSAGDVSPLTLDELYDLADNSDVFGDIGGERIPVKIHSINRKRKEGTPIGLKYSYDVSLRYRDLNYMTAATIIKKVEQK